MSLTGKWKVTNDEEEANRLQITKASVTYMQNTLR